MDAQQAVVESDARRLVIYGGPGTGKTHTIRRRVERFLDLGAKPSEICIVTFSRQAARELRARLRESSGLWISTLHSLAYHLLLRHPDFCGVPPNIEVYPSPTPETLDLSPLGEILDQLSVGGRLRINGKRLTPSRMCAAVNQDGMLRDRYRLECLSRGVLDFDLLIDQAKAALLGGGERPEQFRFRYLFVDEAQDLNQAQIELVTAISGEWITIVGDPDQAVYEFQGATPGWLAGLQRTGEWDVITLERSHRCPHHILDVSNRFADVVTGLASHKQEPGTVEFYECDTVAGEAALISRLIKESGRPLRDIAVLARTHYRVSVLSSGLQAACIPVQEPLAADMLWRSRVGARVLMALQFLDRPSVRRLAAVERDKSITEQVSRLCRDGRDVLAALAFVSIDHPLLRAYEIRANGAPVSVLVDVIGSSLVSTSNSTPGEREVCRVHLPQLARQWETSEISNGDPQNLRGFVEFVMRHNEQDWIVPGRDAVTVGTIHSAKGREWALVFVAGCDDGEIPYGGNESNLAEERRLLRVATSRAMERLCISWPTVVVPEYSAKGAPETRSASRFIQPIIEELGYERLSA